MALDARLDLGRYISNPFNKKGDVTKRLNFNDLFESKADSGDYPWNPSRFESKDLTRRAMTKKLVQNPLLEFVPNTPFFDGNKEVTPQYEVFIGVGRFNRPEDYDFQNGRALTRQRPEEQPDYNPAWMEAYRLSPTLPPGKAAKNPMPRMKNPDPNGFIMKAAEIRVENEIQDKQSVSQLLSPEKKPDEKKVKEEERQGSETPKADAQAVG